MSKTNIDNGASYDSHASKNKKTQTHWYEKVNAQLGGLPSIGDFKVNSVGSLMRAAFLSNYGKRSLLFDTNDKRNLAREYAMCFSIKMHEYKTMSAVSRGRLLNPLNAVFFVADALHLAAREISPKPVASFISAALGVVLAPVRAANTLVNYALDLPEAIHSEVKQTQQRQGERSRRVAEQSAHALKRDPENRNVVSQRNQSAVEPATTVSSSQGAEVSPSSARQSSGLLTAAASAGGTSFFKQACNFFGLSGAPSPYAGSRGRMVSPVVSSQSPDRRATMR